MLLIVKHVFLYLKLVVNEGCDILYIKDTVESSGCTEWQFRGGGGEAEEGGGEAEENN